jgi:fatty acid-binding protein DegV
MVFDSCSTVKNDEYSDVYVLPLMIIERQKAGGNYVEYRDLTEINEEGVIKKLLNGSILSTSQSSPKDTLELFDRITSEYDEIFVFPGPVTITKQYESFKTILSEYDNVHIFNQNMLGKMAQ